MKRWLIAMTTFVLVTAACTAGGGSSDAPSAVDTGSGASHAPVTLQMWGAWTGRELRQFNKIFDGFTAKYPWITVNSVGGVNDQKIIASINAGNPPDAVLSFTLDSVGQFCASGAWQDLNPYIEQSGFDVSQFPPSVEAYTSFAGSRCAFPFLTDAQGLYYNTDLFKKAGIADAPKTLTELEADAKKLTTFNSDGSIKVAGFVPWFGHYEFSTPNLGNLFGAKWYNDDGTATVVDTDPAWKAMFQWQHDFIANVFGGGDFQTGSDKLQRFVAGSGDEFSSAQDFETGRVAMNFDGEWRTAFIADEVPDLPYATAPYPMPDDRADAYGIRSRSEARSSGSRRVRRTPTRRGFSSTTWRRTPRPWCTWPTTSGTCRRRSIRSARRTWMSLRSSRRSWTSSRTPTRTTKSRRPSAPRIKTP